MDSKYKQLLQFHRPFLSRNIIWSSQLSDMFKSHGLVTDYVIKDINACPTREEQINRLIEVIPLKGRGAFHKFLDVLMLSGHVFISDFLREDEDNQKCFDVKEMYKALPFVQRAFNETEKKAIESYMTEKIENQVLKLLWKRDNREKDKALEAKMKQIEQSYEFEDKLQDHYKEKAATIKTLEHEIHSALENKEELKTKISALTAAHRDVEAKHKQAMEVQMRYNSANDNAVEKAKTTINGLETLLQALHTKLETELTTNEKYFPEDIYDSTTTSSKNISSNNNNSSSSSGNNYSNKEKTNSKPAENGGTDMSLYTSQFGFVLGDVEKLIARYRHLLGIKIKHDRLIEEKEYILIHFGVSDNEDAKQKSGGMPLPDREPSMIKAYKDYAVRQDENLDKMKKQIEKYDGLLEENKAKLEGLAKEKEDTSKRMTQGLNSWQGAIMNVMRNQLQDLKTDSRKKESMMAMQEEEMSKLKNKIVELENRLACASYSQPDSLSLAHPRDMVDGRLSAVSNDSVELIVSETPKPTRNKNLPPLRSSTKPAAHHPNKSSSPRGTVMRSSKPHMVPPKPNAESSKNYITFPMGPISTQIKPDVRGRPMGSVLGDLKAMNKHHKPGALENPKSAWKQNGSASLIK